MDEAALAEWRAPRRSTPGDQLLYADLAIQAVLMVRLVFHLALRQAAGMAVGVLRLLGLDMPVPDHTTLSRHGRAFAGRQLRARAGSGPVHLVLDSTGLELFGQGEWDAAKHSHKKRRWMKLHLAVNAGTGESAAHVLTEGAADDAAQVPDLLRTVEGTIVSLNADGAYDGEPTYAAVAARQPKPPPSVVISPARLRRAQHGRPCPANSARPPRAAHGQDGAQEWQRRTGYGRRALAETTMSRWKCLIGPRLLARSLPGQQGETALAAMVLNRMTRTAKPVSVRLA